MCGEKEVEIVTFNNSNYCPLHTGFLLGILISDPEQGSDMFLRNFTSF
jgi:hypothetical protein